MVKLEEVDEDTYPEQPNTYNPDDEEGWDTDSGMSASHPPIPHHLMSSYRIQPTPYAIHHP